jgi:uncharacterized SAM-binding protein YcdF (DUF218 family)
MTDKEIDNLARKLYNYGTLHQPLGGVDAIIALGNMDIRIAQKAAGLWHEGLAPVIVTSGGTGRLTPKEWDKPEAVMFADEIRRQGVPDNKVLVEPNSTNLPENVRFSLDVLRSIGVQPRSVILVALPFAERRILALCKKQFPEIRVLMSSSDVSYEEFPAQLIDRQEALNLIVGEIDRLDTFPSKGFSVPGMVPRDILDARTTLIEAGFNKYQV